MATVLPSPESCSESTIALNSGVGRLHLGQRHEAAHTSRRFCADSSSLVSALSTPLTPPLTWPRPRTTESAGIVFANFARGASPDGDGIEAADGPGVAGVEVVDLLHELGVRDDVGAGVGVDRVLDGGVAAERDEVRIEERERPCRCCRVLVGVGQEALAVVFLDPAAVLERRAPRGGTARSGRAPRPPPRLRDQVRRAVGAAA